MKRDILLQLPSSAIEQAAKVMPAIGFRLTDIGNAERLAARCRNQIRYCNARRRWLTYDGTKWVWDETGEIQRLAKLTVRGIYEEAALCADGEIRKHLGKHARDSEKGARVASMITLAQSENGIPVKVGQLDADAYVLNCANGTIDLRSGKLLEHHRGDLITKSTGIAYDPNAKSELWDRVLNDATGGDTELAAYLQEVAGYSLIGEPIERAFFFLFGPPATAKSTFIEALHAALGEYAHSADFDTWLLHNNIGGNRGDLVRLAGARLVTSVEVRQGAKWDEALIKRVTGGDEVVASAKFESEVSFRPAFTLLLAANDAPTARDDDEGLWARMRRIPLAAQIPPERQDPTIKTKLRQPEHAAAVLAWAVAGCLEYQRRGFGKSAAVDESTAAYRADNDHFGEFLNDVCFFDPIGRITRKQLRTAYEEWAEETGRRSLIGHKEVSIRLRARGCSSVSVMGNRTWVGLRLRSASDPE